MLKWEISTPCFESDILNSALSVSPWAGHRRFVYDLIKFMKPKNVLELGTHYGCSFFAMCQSIKDYKYSTVIEAVDTWVGDSQAGFYGEDVYQIVNQTLEQYFSNVSTKLHRMTFDEALNQFEDERFDIIHIDGFHEYAAVKHDFTTFLPKLKENGVMLFHDIAAYTGYGSSIFWAEIKREYSSFEFIQSWGLGVLFPKGDALYNNLIQQNIADKILFYNSKSELDIAEIKLSDLEKLGLERFQTIQEMDQMIKDRDITIESQAKLLEERLEIMNRMEEMIISRDSVIDAQNKMVEERLDSIMKMEAMIRERDEIIASQKLIIEERYCIIQEMDTMIKDRDTAIAAQDDMLKERYAAIQEMDQMIKERDHLISELS